jgi:hypothetical protein
MNVQTPPFTLPFNISTLVFLMAVKQITRNHVAEDPDVSVAAANLTVGAFFAGSIRGVGQVFSREQYHFRSISTCRYYGMF